MRLIDADALIKTLEEMSNNEWNITVGSSKGLEDAIEVVENAPTIVVRAKIKFEERNNENGKLQRRKG